MIRFTNKDLRLLYQPNLEYAIKVEVLENNAVIDVLHGIIQGGSSSINADSDIRRTFNATIIPTKKNDIKVNENGLIWINKDVHLYIGLKDIRTDEYIWYTQGYYIFANCSGNFDIQTNQLSITCNDYMSCLDGTKNGQIGALTTLIPAYEENEETGEVIKHNIIREAVIKTFTQLGRFKNYFVDDIGEYYAMPEHNKDWKTYREENELWNTIPYDLEFSAGCSVLSILQELVNLYPNYEMFFDENGTFVIQMIPSCYEDDVVFTNDFLQRILISEDSSTDLLTVRNVCEVWGEVIETDFYTESCTYSGNCYTCTVDGYEEKYYNGDIISIKVPSTNLDGATLNVNSFGSIPIMDENTEKPITANRIESANSVYSFKIKKKRVDGNDVVQAYLLGQWQPHAINVLTDGTVGEDYTSTSGVTAKRYSKEYFKTVYNCESIEFTTIPESPFTIQKLGEIRDVKQGGEFENITSDSLALARAEYENWKNSRLTDSITITTLLIPFADVNIKVEYKPNDVDEVRQYIIKSVNHNFDSGQSTLQLTRFYPLYIPENENN